ncbi:MAG: class I SAM-dependent methyltransferase [Caldisericia bacterium]
MKDWFLNWFDENYLKYNLITQSKDLTKKQVDFIIDVLSLKEKDRILDLGCGIGRHLIEFGKKGIKGVGIDFNKKFINIAKKNKQKNKYIKFINMDIRKINFVDEFDAAISIWTSFGYFKDEENIDLLKKINRSLKKGGKLLIDIENINYLINNLPKERWENNMGVYILERNKLNIKSSRVKTIRILIKNNKKYEYIRDYRIYTLVEIKNYLENSGFKLTTFYGGYEKEELNLFSKRLIMISEKL